jgi:hypothetical protein
MFRWYERAEVCYAYLSDVLSASEDPSRPYSQFSQSKWFTRGWTLQELLAPNYVDFFDQTWTWIGSKGSLDAVIRNTTSIADLIHYRRASVAQKMSWASYRETTRIEDMSYCLLGLFGVHMPPLYGEGENAFIRLQREIMSMTDDDSILAWKPVYSGHKYGLLATSPRLFADCSSVVRVVWDPNRPPHTMSSKGLCVHLKLVSRSDDSKIMSGREFLAPLNCAFGKGPLSRDESREVIALQMYRVVLENNPHWHRRHTLRKTNLDPGGWAEIDRTMLYVPQPSEEERVFKKTIAKRVRVLLSIDSLIRTGFGHKEYFACKWGACWETVRSPRVADRVVLDVRVDVIFPRWAAITLGKMAKHSGPRNKPYKNPENYFQKVAIVVGGSNGRPWIDILVLDKNEDMELILKAFSETAEPPSEENGVVDSESTASVRALATGLDRVSRQFLSGSLNGRLMTVHGMLSEVIVEVSYDPGGKLRWPVRAPLSSQLSAANQAFT